MVAHLFGTKSGIIWGMTVPSDFTRTVRRRERLYGFFFRWTFIGITTFTRERA